MPADRAAAARLPRAPRRPLQRLLVAGMLWLDSNEERALASLRSALWRASRPGLRPRRRASTRSSRSTPSVRVDVREASPTRTALIDARADDADSPMRRPLAGELLPDWYDDWLLIERERFRQLAAARARGAVASACSAPALRRGGRGRAGGDRRRAAARERAPRADPRPPRRGQPERGAAPVRAVPAHAARRARPGPSPQLVALMRVAGDGRVTQRRQAPARWPRREPSAPAFS